MNPDVTSSYNQWDSSSWKGLRRSLAQPPAQRVSAGRWTGLLRALPRGLKTSEGDSTVSLGNLHCLLPDKVFHYTQSVPLMVWLMLIASYLPNEGLLARLHLLHNLQIGIGSLCSCSHFCDYQGPRSGTDSVFADWLVWRKEFREAGMSSAG